MTRAAARHQAIARTRPADDQRSGREVRPRHDLEQRHVVDCRIVDQRHRGVDDLRQVVRRNVGRHADGDAARAINQQVRELRRQNRRLLAGAVIVVLEIDRVLVDIVQQVRGHTRHAAFGVAHGCRRIAVDRAEVTLTINQRHAHGERLRHAHKRVIDRLVAVRVPAADHIADDVGGLPEGLVVRVAAFICSKQDAAVNRFQPVAHVRKRTAHDHAHRVIEVRLLQFRGDGNGRNVARAGATVRSSLIRRIAQAEFVRKMGGAAAGIRDVLLAHLCAATQTIMPFDPQA
jgi:cell division protein ZapA (FtsZ GTPase activity inhibitor)